MSIKKKKKINIRRILKQLLHEKNEEGTVQGHKPIN